MACCGRLRSENSRSAILFDSGTTIRDTFNRRAKWSERYKSSVPAETDGLVTELGVGVCAIDLALRNAGQLDVSNRATARDFRFVLRETHLIGTWCK